MYPFKSIFCALTTTGSIGVNIPYEAKWLFSDLVSNKDLELKVVGQRLHKSKIMVSVVLMETLDGVSIVEEVSKIMKSSFKERSLSKEDTEKATKDLKKKTAQQKPEVMDSKMNLKTAQTKDNAELKNPQKTKEKKEADEIDDPSKVSYKLKEKSDIKSNDSGRITTLKLDDVSCRKTPQDLTRNQSISKCYEGLNFAATYAADEQHFEKCSSLNNINNSLSLHGSKEKWRHQKESNAKSFNENSQPLRIRSTSFEKDSTKTKRRRKKKFNPGKAERQRKRNRSDEFINSSKMDKKGRSEPVFPDVYPWNKTQSTSNNKQQRKFDSKSKANMQFHIKSSKFWDDESEKENSPKKKNVPATEELNLSNTPTIEMKQGAIDENVQLQNVFSDELKVLQRQLNSLKINQVQMIKLQHSKNVQPIIQAVEKEIKKPLDNQWG